MKIDTAFLAPEMIESAPKGQRTKGSSFADTLKAAISETNASLKASEKASLDLAQGQVESIHDAMITMQKASISLQLLVTSTNKIIEGYNELLRLR